MKIHPINLTHLAKQFTLKNFELKTELPGRPFSSRFSQRFVLFFNSPPSTRLILIGATSKRKAGMYGFQKVIRDGFRRHPSQSPSYVRYKDAYKNWS